MELFLEILSNAPVFYGLTPEKIEAVLSGKLYRFRRFEKNGVVAHAGDKCENLMFILEGSVRGEMTDFSGKVIKIEDIHPPRPVAPAFLFGNQNLYPVDIIANEAVTMLVLPKESFVTMMQENPLILSNFLDSISNRAQFLSNRLRFLNFKTIKGKIAFYLLKLSARAGNQLMLPMNQTQLADFFGVARPSLARALSELEKERVLKVEGRKVDISDPLKLKALIH